MTIKNLGQAKKLLMAYMPVSPNMTPKDTTLQRIGPVMELLGNPQDRLKTVHIAGTSGKTSTAYYMAALLTATGQKTGLTVSPHVDSITERVQINGQPLTETEFCDELGVFLDILGRVNLRPSYFELLYAFTLWVLTRRGVDYAVIETGVGGLHDATNVAKRADKVCVITDIGLDHTRLLGDTLSAITAQKVGIVHDNNHLFMYRQADEIMSVVEQWAGQHEAPVHVLSEADEQQAYHDDLGAMPDYQRRNWLLAHHVYRYLAERDNLQYLTRQVLRETQTLQVPGRMDIRQLGSKTIVMDGAHNEQKMTAFVSSFKRLYPGVKPAVLLALKQGKEYKRLVPILSPLADRIIVTTFSSAQDLPVTSMDAELLARAFRAGGAAHVESVPDHQAAVHALLAAPEKVCVITGSFYLLSQIRNNEHLA